MSPPIAILSPHLDDAVLSCWHVLTGPGEVVVVNVFAGTPPAGGSPGWWDRETGGHDPAAVMAERVEEDRRALALAGREAVNLDFLDAQYRSEPQPVAPLTRAIELALPGGATIHAPGAVGATPRDDRSPNPPDVPHPDHVAVRAAALELAARGHDVRLYADLPHASAHGLPAWVTGDGDGPEQRAAEEMWERMLATAGIDLHELEPDVRRLTGEAFERKVEAVGAYASQAALLEEIFGGPLTDPRLLGHEVEWRLSPG